MIVLDTHVFLWYANGDPHLASELMNAIRNCPGEVFISPVTIWEALMLDEKGRVGIRGPDKLATLRTDMSNANIKEARLTIEIAALSRTLQFAHNDPADRFIAATAYSLGASLATQDDNLRKLPWITLTV